MKPTAEERQKMRESIAHNWPIPHEFVLMALDALDEAEAKSAQAVDTCGKLADAITRDQAEIAELRAALREACNIAFELNTHSVGGHSPSVDEHIAALRAKHGLEER